MKSITWHTHRVASINKDWHDMHIKKNYKPSMKARLGWVLCQPPPLKHLLLVFTAKISKLVIQPIKYSRVVMWIPISSVCHLN
jgi:hypothetical protein